MGDERYSDVKKSDLRQRVSKTKQYQPGFFMSILAAWSQQFLDLIDMVQA